MWAREREREKRIWPYEKNCVFRAIQCGMSIQKYLHNTTLTSGVNLSVKIGIGWGKANIVFIGGHLGRYENLCAGTCLSEAFQCEHNATAGDVIVSSSIEQFIADKTQFITEWIPDTECYLIKKQRQKIRARRFRTPFRAPPSPPLSYSPLKKT